LSHSFLWVEFSGIIYKKNDDERRSLRDGSNINSGESKKKEKDLMFPPLLANSPKAIVC